MEDPLFLGFICLFSSTFGALLAWLLIKRDEDRFVEKLVTRVWEAQFKDPRSGVTRTTANALFSPYERTIYKHKDWQ